jgi:molybdenum-dependent DNA-binding transcriptional regulator ModE
MAAPPGTSTTASLTDTERRLVEAFRRLEPAQQRVLWNALIHLASGVPGAMLVLAVDR